jgi:hypothetical protein
MVRTVMDLATSRDGTAIAYDEVGGGPPVILVAGALCARLSWVLLRFFSSERR